MGWLTTFKRWVTNELGAVSNNLLYQREGWQDASMAVTATKLQGSKDPDFTKFADDGAGSQGVFSYAFDKNTEEEVYFELQLPHGRVPKSNLRPHVHWAPTSAAAGNVVFGLEYTAANVGDVFPDTTIITSEVDPAAGVAKTHQIAGFDEINGVGVTDSAVFLCRVFRDATNADDTYGADVVILSLDFHVLMRGLGSDEEYPS